VRQHQSLGPERPDSPRYLAREGVSIPACVQLHVTHAKAAIDNCEGKVAHGRKKKRHPLLVARDVRRLLAHFHHEHRVDGGIELAQQPRPEIQLVPEDDCEVSDTSRYAALEIV
jgi:hypothetical protein